MSLMTQAMVVDKYGLRLTIDQIAEALKIGKSTIYNQVSAKTFPIPTYVDGGKRYARYQEVAEYLDGCLGRGA